MPTSIDPALAHPRTVSVTHREEAGNAGARARGSHQPGLEISGTLEEDIEARHRDKVRQLLANPYRIDGYALAVRFAVPEVLFSFHRFGEQAR